MDWPTIAYIFRFVTCLTLLAVAPLARAAGVQVKAARRPVHVSDEPGELYHLLGIGRPVVATVRGPGELTLGLRVQAPANGQGQAHVQVQVDGTPRFALDLAGPGVAKFLGHRGTYPGQRVDRRIHIDEGNHAISVAADGGPAAVTFAFEREGENPLAVAPLTPAPLAAAPLTPAPLTPAPLAPEPEAAPLAPIPAAPPPPAIAAAQPTPAPPAAVEAEPKTEAPRAKSTLPYYIAGGAVLLGGGAITAWALGNGAYGSYKTTPEVQNGSPTNRAGILSQANNDAGWATGLGIAAVVALAGAAAVWSFW